MPARLSCRLLLRAALHLLLVTGLVAGPALAAASELHGIEHAALAAEGHGHAHAADGDPPHGDPHDGDSGDPDHATGAHGLVHQIGSLPVAMPCDGIWVSTPPVCAQRIPEFHHCHLPGNSPSLPFRPPIA